MTTEIDENGNIWISSCDKYQEAAYYAKLAKNPEPGITARQMKAAREGKSVTIRFVGEVEDDKTN